MINLSDLDSNIYLLDGDTIIDSGTGSNFVRLYEIFKQMKLDFDNIKNIVNTHMHWDHIGGNGFFKNAKIHIHEKDSDVLEKGNAEMCNSMYFSGNMHPMKVERKLKEGDEIFGFKVLHTPGHTAGSICLFDPKDNILVSGDTIFSDGVGRTDLPGGNESDLNDSIEKLSNLNIEAILPGHGEPVLKSGNKAIKNIISSVAEEL
ncbi:MAG: MBL fold metallo-hydrolase [Candidatus Aenigmarchaeota archaeon]|nr:MBL fold metallo-hydrolase [Candidatus Aenigmarchaeota archaeon]NIQ17301.1 MBL fold metallo-hydrolase [Candidatus Aenigmarchaeota archaeon]NIS73162.1 MBL fold metallo-hydrolase [Candidatus Aenigmarchaeota archaeon]